MGTSISAGTIMAYMDLDMSSFNSAIDMAGEQLSGFASGGVAGALGSIGAAAETAGRALTLGVTAPLMTAAGAAIQTGMQFDASMSNVYGLMSSLNLSQAQMDALRDTAREMGATTKFSASEAADAMGYIGAGRLGRCAGHCRYSGRIESGGCRQHGSGESLGYRDRYDDSVRHGGGACGRGSRRFCLCAGKQQHNRRRAGRGDEVRRADGGRLRYDAARYCGSDGRAGERGHQGQSGRHDAERDAARHEEQRQERRNRYRQNQSRADQRGRKRYRSYAAIIRDIDKATSSMTASQRDAALGAIFGDESLKGYSGDAQAGTRRAGRDDRGHVCLRRRGRRYGCHDGRQPQGRSGDP